MTQEVTERVEALLPTLRERAQEAEDLRRIPDESMKALQETGFFRLLQPKQWGGHAADPVVFYDTVRKIASACGSTGWVAGIIGVHNWHLALFDQQAHKTPDTLAVVSGQTRLTYRELYEASNRLGRLLRARGAKPIRPGTGSRRAGGSR